MEGRGVGDSGGARHATHLRGLNLERVLTEAMDRPGPFTRAELATATRLSAPTVGSLTSHLIESGLLKDLGTGPSSGGRRPFFMEFHARHGFVAGIDVGPTRTRLAVCDLRGEPLGHGTVPTPQSGSPAADLASLARSLHRLMDESEIPRDRLLAVGAGAPGSVDYEKGVVALAPNLLGWVRVPMRDLLQRALGAPVLVENDVNLAVLGERWRGVARGHDTCVFVLVGTGIGAGVLIDGRLHRGHHYQAGEISLMCMGPQYLEGDYGRRGCLETLAGMQALAGRWPGTAGAGSTDWVAKLLESAKADQREARDAVQESARLIGIAVANLCTVVDPSLIVLGGALFDRSGEVTATVRRIVQRFSREPVEIAVSALGKQAPLHGSVLIATMEAREVLRLQLREGRLLSDAAQSAPGQRDADREIAKDSRRFNRAPLTASSMARIRS